MSKILRRPMFRGGPVDSRGTGITTGLDQPRIGAANGRFISGADLLSAAQSFPQLNMFKNIKFNPQSKYVLGQDEDIDRIASFAGEGMDPGFQDLAFADTFNISAPEDMTPTFEKVASLSSNTPVVEEKSTLSEMDDYSFKPTQNTEEKGGILDLSKGKETKKTKINDDEPEVTMTDLEKALGLDKARQEYAADALAAASAAFFEGKGFGAIADAAKVKSKAPDIKRLAGLEEFKAKKAKELYDAQTKAKRFAPGNVEKTVEYLMRQGMDKDEAIRRATKQSGSFAEALSKHKTGPAILPTGFALAAEEFYGSEYKGDEPTDGSMPIGTKAEISDGVYTDKSNKIIFEIKDKIVVFSRKYSE